MGAYNLLKRFAKGGGFRKELKNRDGHYYISIDKEVFDELRKLDDDLNKAIFLACLGNGIK